MNAKLSLLGLVALIALGCYLMPQPKIATAQNPSAAASDVVEYAQLTISGNVYTFEEGGARFEPRKFDLDGMYRELNGRQRPSLVNLLQAIGTRGWELVDVSQDRDVYVFMRRN